ncbi:division/cell wall cluster transcriptional repressor MraZ [Anaerosphaera multitolerans]|uniref:Transcriptional regulator MraZ n=1 Tax=Anaerosphaera multitolerans TaxID=2487351 RepID=A0A437S7M7_9FIRM|nr:division/cell wall cluster transcriptional repressor MraZ [Anaerosphaera multitolerans]RVU54847.1 transcriptional regulator MraZ [Anaerosphaera multitolerans]
MLIGEYRHSLDSKGRMIIPAKFRDELGEEFVMTKGLDNCLFVYPKDEWIKIENKLKNLPMTNKAVRSFVRTFFSGAVDQSLDKQGRVLIPQNLREHSQINKEAVVIGVSTRVEIWSTENWDSYNDDEGLSYEEMAEKMTELGI